MSAVKPWVKAYAENPVPQGLVFAHSNLYRAYRKLSELFVPMRPHRHALVGLQRLFQAASISGMHKGFVLTGDSGAGKTSTSRQLDSWLCEQYEVPKEASPLLFVLVPTDSSHKALLSAILAKLGDPLCSSGTAPALAERVKRFVAARRVVGIVLDEFQHVFEGKSANQARTVAQTVKNLVNSLEIPVILLGQQSVRQFVEGSPELSQRFTRKASLPDFEVRTTADVQDFRMLLAELDRLDMLSDGLKFDTPDMGRRLLAASRCNLGRMMKLLQQACEEALHTEAKAVGLPHLSAAFRVGADNSDAEFDPFDCSMDVINSRVARLKAKP